MQRSSKLFFIFYLFTLFAFSLSISASQEDAEDLATFRAQADPHNDDAYLPEFPSLSRSIIGRADSSEDEELVNNVPASGNTIQPGSKQFYQFPSSALHGPKSTSTPVIPNTNRRRQDTEQHHELRKRDADVTYYLTLNTCSQPTSSSDSDPPPPLLLFISYTNPRPDGTQNNAHVPPVIDGFASFSDPTSGDVFVGVEALTTSQYTGSYTFELTVSIDGYYANYVDNSTLYYVDSDNGAAMFVSANLAEPNEDGSVDTTAVTEWNDLGPRYNLYVANQADNSFNGLMRSSCALRNTTQPGGSTSDQSDVRVETGLTTVAGPSLQQQFYLSGLQPGTSYFAAMGLPTNYSSDGPGQPGGGGILYKQVAFTTKSIGNCKIIYNQTFCPQINYAVPFNPNLFDGPNLTTFYNNQSEFNYQFFENALQQVACATSNDSQYSLAVTCDDCRAAYTDWLCTVMNPRCYDFSSQLPYLHARAVAHPIPPGISGISSSDPLFNSTFQHRLAFNSSRNPAIDSVVQPGPYKELLPCGDVCYKLVRACPSVMGFACPYDPQGYNSSYGYPLMDGLNPQCNDPRAVFGVSSGDVLRPSLAVLFGFSALMIAIG